MISGSARVHSHSTSRQTSILVPWSHHKIKDIPFVHLQTAALLLRTSSTAIARAISSNPPPPPLISFATDTYFLYCMSAKILIWYPQNSFLNSYFPIPQYVFSCRCSVILSEIFLSPSQFPGRDLKRHYSAAGNGEKHWIFGRTVVVQYLRCSATFLSNIFWAGLHDCTQQHPL